MKTNEQLTAELRAATEGLLLMSESDHPLEVVRWEDCQQITHEFLRREAGKGADAPVEEVGAAQVFRAAASEPEWKGEEELRTARRFQALLRLLGENLEGLTAYRVGAIDITVYVVGRGREGDWLGVATRVVET